MSNQIRFEVPGEAVSATVRVVRFGGHAGIRKGSSAEAWEGLISLCAQQARGEWQGLFEGPVSVKAMCWFSCPKSEERKREPAQAKWKTSKPDVDKIARCVLDALTGVLYKDDAQVCELGIRKGKAAQGEPARTIIQVTELSEKIE